MDDRIDLMEEQQVLPRRIELAAGVVVCKVGIAIVTQDEIISRIKEEIGKAQG